MAYSMATLRQLADAGRRRCGMVIVFAFAVTFVVAKVLDWTMGLRVSEREEEVGLDISEHGERAYA